MRRFGERYNESINSTRGKSCKLCVSGCRKSSKILLFFSLSSLLLLFLIFFPQPIITSVPTPFSLAPYRQPPIPLLPITPTPSSLPPPTPGLASNISHYPVSSFFVNTFLSLTTYSSPLTIKTILPFQSPISLLSVSVFIPSLCLHFRFSLCLLLFALSVFIFFSLCL